MNTQPFSQTGQDICITKHKDFDHIFFWMFNVVFAEVIIHNITLSDYNWTQTQNHLIHKWTLNHLAKLGVINDWAVFWVLICTVHLTVCSYHVMYTFQSESTLYSCLNIKELLARSRRKIWSLSDWNWTRTHNHQVVLGSSPVAVT